MIAAATGGRREAFDQPLGFVAALGAEGALDQRLTLAPDGLVDDPFALGLRLVGGDVGLRGRTDVELEPPTPPALDFAAPQVEDADFRQSGVQVDGDRFGGKGDRSNLPGRPSGASPNWTVPFFPFRVRSTVRIGGSAVICAASMGTSSPGLSVNRVLETNSGNSAGSETNRSKRRSLSVISCPGSMPAGNRQTTSGARSDGSVAGPNAVASTPM